MKKQFNVKFDNDIYAKIKLMATIDGVTMTDVIYTAIEKQFSERKEELAQFKEVFDKIKNNR